MISNENKEKKSYSSVKDYQVLEDIEHVRKRPGNYIGSTNESGWHHLFQEIIDNSIDEAVAGNCDSIKVFLSDDQKSVTVEDNGLGIPIAIHPKTQQSVLVTLFSFLKSGGKFSDKIYKTSGGLHGLGVTVVNALAKNLKVWNKRQGKTQIAEFSQGILQKEEVLETPNESDGVVVFFTPDPVIFSEFTYFKIDIISSRLKELSYLNPRLTITFYFSSQQPPLVFYNVSGLVGLVNDLNQENFLLGTDVCNEEWSRFDPYFYLNFAWQYLNNTFKRYLNRSFCNNIFTSGGGTHVEGFEAGFANALKDWIKEKYPQIKVNIVKDDVFEGLTVALAIRIKEPQFSGQTKNSLSDKYVRDIVKKVVYDLSKKFLQDHASTAENVCQRIIIVAQNRVKTEEYQSSLRDSGRGVILPGKLTPCISKTVAETFLFLVEGDSAGGSAKLARDPNTQAILPLQGKIINIEKSENKRIFANEEIKNIINALGFSVGEVAENYYNRFQPKLDDLSWDTVAGLPEDFVFQDEKGEKKKILAHVRLNRDQLEKIVQQTKEELLKKIRYGKIVLMADADPDGNHIKSLELTFFMSYFRFLIEEKRLFLAVPPLYRWQQKKQTEYFYSDYELEVWKKNNSLVGGHLQYFKGLGEMDPVDLRETTMDPLRCRFYCVLLTKVIETNQVINDLMGSDSEKRRQYLEEEHYRNVSLSVVDNQVELHHALLVNFLDYAYEVVEDRALPGEDGLKPVQRRIVYTCYQLGLLPSVPRRKSSKIVGDVMGDYHPHGNESIYQAMVKMAQDFNYRYPLIDGQGNWGSIDGDSPAQMRYTEARLTPFGFSLLNDLVFDTVEWKDNYDGTKKEPCVLPPTLNLLLNGSCGIAVGMNTNIPPHNLSEIAEAIVWMAENPDADYDELFNKVPVFPDFPTGGCILDCQKLKDIYQKGEGTIYVRAKWELISGPNSKKIDTIRVFEIPYKVAKAKLIEHISLIIKNKKIEGLKSVDDYSNLENPVNIYLRFDSNYDSEVILNQLFKQTKLQSTFPIKIRVLINKKPKLLSLWEIFHNFIELRLEHIKKKSQFLYNKNQKELENLETRYFIINNYQKIAEIVRQESSENEIKKKLEVFFSLSESIVNRILDTPSTFRQFTPERKKKIEENIEQLKKGNEEQILLINQREKRLSHLIKELRDLQKIYLNDFRRTNVSSEPFFISERQLIPFEERTVVFSYIKSKSKIDNFLTINSLSFLEATNVPSRGKELKVRGEPWSVVKMNRRDDIWCFSNYGRVYLISFYKIMGLNKVINLDEEYFVRETKGKIVPFLRPLEFFIFFLPVKENIVADFLLTITTQGKIKLWKLTTLLKRIGKTGKQLLPLKKTVIRCKIHQDKFLTHQQFIHRCGVLCKDSRQLHWETKMCFSCQIVWQKNEDQFARAVFLKEGDFVEAAVKRRTINGNLKNQLIPLFRYVRQKKLVLIDDKMELLPVYCEQHNHLASKHLKMHRDLKTTCSVGCSFFLNEVKKEINRCSGCQHISLFSRNWKRNIRGEEIVDLIVFEEKTKKENGYSLVLIRNNGSMEKKSYSFSRKFLGNDSRFKKTSYCKKHWIEFNGLLSTNEKISLDCQEEKKNLENRLLVSPLPLPEKEKLIKKISLNGTREFLRKIVSSPVDPLIGKKATEDQINVFLEDSRHYKKLEQMLKNSTRRLDDWKEQIKDCVFCQKFCPLHSEKVFLHQSCHHCEQLRKSIEMVKSEEKDIEKNATKKKQVLEEEIKAKKKEKKKLYDQAFSLRLTCPLLREFKQVRENCLECQKQRQKKHLANINNPLKKVFLIKKKCEKIEMYLLAKDETIYAYLYGKKDLFDFLQKESRNKVLLRDKNRSISFAKIFVD